MTTPDASTPSLRLIAAPRAQASGGRWIDLAALDALLLAWLAIEGPTARERLAALLWPDSDGESARNALRQRLFRLRRQFGRELVIGGSTLQLAPAESHDLDSGPGLLGVLELPAQAALAEWLQASRQRRAALARQAALARLDELEAAGALGTAFTVAASLVQADPLSEEGHRRLIRLHYLRGDRAAALLAFDRLESLLRDEVGTRPSEATLELLRTVEATGRPAAAAVPRAPELPASVLRPPRLVGREGELLALRAGWAVGQVVLLIGEAGMGKSRLLQSMAADGEAVVSASARPGDALIPFASIARLLQQLIHRVPGALDPPLQARLAPLLPALSVGADTPPAGRRVPMLEPVRQLLARAQPGLGGFVLDDLHFADDASIELLQGLLSTERGSETPLEARAAPAGRRWLIGLRPPADGSRLAAFVAAVGAAAPLVRLVLKPLDPAQVAELVDSLGIPGVSGAAIGAALWQRTGGNPLFALETLKAAWAEGTLERGGELPRPPSLDQLIDQQLDRLSPLALALARLSAVAGSDFSLPLAEQVLGLRALQLVDPWQELESRQVMVEGEFAHDLVFEAVHAGVPAPIARHLHGEVAAWLEQRGGEPARLAAHWEAAGRRDRALPWLRAAAERAHRSLRETERIGFLLRAAEIAEAGGQRAEAFECVAQAVASHMNAIRQADGFPLLDRLDRLADGDADRSRALGLRAWYSSQLGDLPRAVACGEEALARLAPLLRPPPTGREGEALVALAGGIRQRLATALAMLGRFDDALPHFEAMQPWAEAHLSSDDLAEFHGNFAVALDNLGYPARALPQHRLAIAASERAGNHAQRSTQLANQAVGRLNAGEVGAAEALLVQAQQLIQAFDLHGSSAGFVAVLRLQCCRALGRYREALALADHAEQLLRAALPTRLPVVWLHRAHCWLDLGQYARAQQALAAAEGGLPPHSEARRLLLLARWQRELAQDAAETIDRAALIAPRTGWPEVTMLVEAERATGLPAEAARSRLGPAIQRARAFGLRGALLALLVRLADGGDAEAATEALALAADGVQPSLLTAGSLHLACARAFEAAGDGAAAANALAEGGRWVHAAAAAGVDPEFRDGFLRRRAEHRLLGAGLTRERVTPS